MDRSPERDAMRNRSCTIPCHGGRQLVLPQGGRCIGGVQLCSLRLNPAASWLTRTCILPCCFQSTPTLTGGMAVRLSASSIRNTIGTAAVAAGAIWRWCWPLVAECVVCLDLSLGPGLCSVLRRWRNVRVLLLKVIQQVDPSDHILEHGMPQQLYGEGTLADASIMTSLLGHWCECLCCVSLP